MGKFKSDFLQVLDERGFIHQISDPETLDEMARKGPITGYIGFDATAPSLHAGSLLPIMMLYWMQQTGHRPITLMGGGTTKVGDPSGKDESRKLLTEEQIAANLEGIRQVFSKFLKFGDGPMLTFESVKLRLDREQPLTFLEFNYMILQAYDFLELYRRMGCVLSWSCTGAWAACCRWAVPTSGATSSTAWS